MGSRWYVKHPTVPLKSIVACLNGDMIGRNDPKTAALLGATAPHRNSPELVEIALAANTSVTKFTIDSSWDDPQHREGWYYRSDHLSVRARRRAGAVFHDAPAPGLPHAEGQSGSDRHREADEDDAVDVRDRPGGRRTRTRRRPSIPISSSSVAAIHRGLLRRIEARCAGRPLEAGIWRSDDPSCLDGDAVIRRLSSPLRSSSRSSSMPTTA